MARTATTAAPPAKEGAARVQVLMPPRPRATGRCYEMGEAVYRLELQ